MNSRLRVGLVDTGLDASAQGLTEALISSRGFSWNQNDECVEPIEMQADVLGHGTALAQTLLSLAPSSPIMMAQVFFEKWSTRPAQVAAAIDWLVDSGAGLINLSLGLRADRSILLAACERALNAGVILVASSPAQGEAVFPAAYEGVIRATGDARCSAHEVSWLNTQQADFGAYVRSPNEKVVGASAGAASLTGHIAHYLSEHPNAERKAVIDHLISIARYKGPERKTGPND